MESLLLDYGIDSGIERRFVHTRAFINARIFAPLEAVFCHDCSSADPVRWWVAEMFSLRKLSGKEIKDLV